MLNSVFDIAASMLLSRAIEFASLPDHEKLAIANSGKRHLPGLVAAIIEQGASAQVTWAIEKGKALGHIAAVKALSEIAERLSSTVEAVAEPDRSALLITQPLTSLHFEPVRSTLRHLSPHDTAALSAHVQRAAGPLISTIQFLPYLYHPEELEGLTYYQALGITRAAAYSGFAMLPRDVPMLPSALGQSGWPAFESGVKGEPTAHRFFLLGCAVCDGTTPLCLAAETNCTEWVNAVQTRIPSLLAQAATKHPAPRWFAHSPGTFWEGLRIGWDEYAPRELGLRLRKELRLRKIKAEEASFVSRIAVSAGNSVCLSITVVPYRKSREVFRVNREIKTYEDIETVKTEAALLVNGLNPGDYSHDSTLLVQPLPSLTVV